MKSTEFITEATQMSLADGSPVAVKSSLGRNKGYKVTMLVTKEVWEVIKDEQANTEMYEYDVATADSIVQDWVNNGAKLVWKSAADWNKEARDLENHRFRKDADTKDYFNAGIDTAKDNARSTSKTNLRTVEDRMYTGDPLETGGTSIPGNAAPALRDLFAKGYIKKGMTVLDFGAGKFARNANYLRDQGVKTFAYDPFNGTGTDGWNGISTQLPSETFDVVFTSFVLNVVPDPIENELLKTVSNLGRKQYHITRNQDITNTVKNALARKDKLVGSFFLKYFATDEEKQMYEEGTITPEVLQAFVKHGVQTSKGFQRIPYLEDKGYKLIRNTGNYKVYEK